jgi:hypothetical protein
LPQRTFANQRFRCFCCFCRKLSAIGIVFVAEMLDFQPRGAQQEQRALVLVLPL